jgi:hypothetical protein
MFWLVLFLIHIIQISYVQSQSFPVQFKDFDYGAFDIDGIKSKISNSYIEYHPLSNLYNHFSLKVPMAWEITKGSSSIVINVQDDSFLGFAEPISKDQYDSFEPKHGIGSGLFQENQTSNFPGDLYQKVSILEGTFFNIAVDYTSSGNILCNLEKNNNKYSWNEGIFGNPIFGKLLKDGHGLNICSQTVSKLNNKGIVGIAPNSMIILSGREDNAENFDIYPSSTPVNKPSMLFYSFREPLDYNNALRNGIPVIGLQSDLEIRWLDNLISSYRDQPSRISVEGVFQEVEEAGDCVKWDPRIVTSGKQSNIYQNNQEIEYCTFNPYVITASNHKWEYVNAHYRKNVNCERDILAPLPVVVLGNNGDYQYHPGQSTAISQVAAIVALMMSTCNTLNILPATLLTNNKHLLPQMAYNIVTFTATKIIPKDYNKNFEESYQYSRQIDVGRNILVDELDRYWSRQALYGKANAFRCVIHSIPKKADYLYSTAETLATNQCHPLDNKYYIHFGSNCKEDFWINDFGYNNHDDIYKKSSNIPNINRDPTANQIFSVYEWGGRHFPGNTEEPWKNNWGETILKDGASILVPNNFVAAIDGILRQPNEKYYNFNGSTKTLDETPDYIVSSGNRIYTEGDGKILITGYLRDIQLEGNIKTDDLEMVCSKIPNSSPDEWYDYTKLKINSSSALASEIYGKVNVYNNSEIGFGDGTNNILVLQPGGELHLYGTKGIEITSGSTLEMAYNSKIIKETTADENLKIHIQDGGTLKILSGAAVTIDIPIEVEPGGQIECEDNTLAWIDNITIKGHSGTEQELFFNTDINKLGVWILPYKYVIGQTTIIRSGKITLMPGASVVIPQVKDDPNSKVKEIAIIGGIDIQGSYTVTPAFPNPIVSLKTGSLTVNNSANFVTGPITTTDFTNVEFKPGSTVTFVTSNQDIGLGISNSFIHNFKIGNKIGSVLEPMVTIKGLKGENKFSCSNSGINTFVLANIQFQGYEGGANYGPLYPPPPQAPSFYAKNVKFENVTLKLINGIKYPVEKCAFSIDGDLLKNAETNNLDLYQDKPSVLLDVYREYFFSYTGQAGDEGYSSLSLINCTFKDNQMINMQWLTSDNTSNIPNFKNHFIGLKADKINNVTIDNSNLNQLPPNPTFLQMNNIDNNHFWGLNSGISTANCGRVTITNSNFGYCRKANDDQNSSVKMCQNSTFRVNTAHSLSSSKFWGTFDNKFHQSNKSTELIGVLAGQNYRGNLFDDYYNGIFMNNSRAFLRGDFTDASKLNIYNMGRNEFITLPLIEENSYNNPLRTYNNPFTDPGQNKYYNEKRTDVFFKSYGSNNNTDYFDGRKPLKIQCGFNKMSDFAPSHLYYDDKNYNSNWPNINVVPDVNEWRPSPNNSIRYNLNNYENITIISPQNNLSTSQDRILGCDNPTSEARCEEIVPIMQPCDFYVRNSGNYPFVQNPDTALDNDFYAYLNDFCNGILSCECYKLRLFDLMQLASLGDSTNEKMNTVITCILNKANDPVYNMNNCDLTNLMLSLGEAYEKKGLLNDALDSYYDIIFNSSNSSDTTIARWRIMNLEAIQADTTYGSVYDSLMSEYHRRVDYDITKTSYSEGAPPPAPKASIQDSDDKDNYSNIEEKPLAELEQNAPNPFINETVIKFRLNKEADVRLGIHDNLGQTIKVIVNQRLKPGNYIYTYFNEGLASGVYLSLLTTDGRQFSKKMQLVK